MKSQSKPTVGYIGLGIMGSAMVANLQKSGYQLVVNDKRVELADKFMSDGAIWASTPREVIEQAASEQPVLSLMPRWT